MSQFTSAFASSSNSAIFPEILEAILKYTVVLPEPSQIVPWVVISNCTATWEMPHHQVLNHDSKGYRLGGELENIVSYHRCQDEEGPFTELRSLYRMRIDASLLRTSRRFYDTGIGLLYGSNGFHFKLTEGRYRPWTWLLGDSKPCRAKGSLPTALGCFEKQRRENAILQLSTRARLNQLEGWAFNDRFIRFLYIIGPQNAARLKHITFSSPLNFHSCEHMRCRSPCKPNLPILLRHYIAFLSILCLKLEKLTFNVYNDGYAVGPSNTSPEFDAAIQESLSPILEKELREIKSLKEVELHGDYDPTDKDLVEETNRWLAERETCRIRALGALHVERAKSATKTEDMADSNCVSDSEDEMYFGCSEE